MDLDDAELTQSRVLGLINEDTVSPLALADTDAELDIADVLLIAQEATGSLMVPIPGPPVVASISAGPPQDTYGLQTPLTLLFPVVSAHPALAALVEGLEVTYAHVGLSGSYLINPAATVVGGKAQVQFVPLNSTSGPLAASVNATVQHDVGVDTGTQVLTVRPNCTKSCVDGEFQVCSDNTPGGKCGTQVGADGNWNLSTVEPSLVGSGNRCSSTVNCSVLILPFTTESPSADFAVWVRVRNSSAYLAGDRYQFIVRDSTGTVTYLNQIVTQSLMVPTPDVDYCGSGPCAPGCSSRNGQMCWVRLTGPLGVTLAAGTYRLYTYAEGTASSTASKYFDGYIYTTDSSYRPDEIPHGLLPPALDAGGYTCDNDAMMTAGTCELSNANPSQKLNWGPNNFGTCPTCGNCLIDGGEVCDDGNRTAAGDGPCNPTCSAWCTDSCGNAVLQTDCGEQCDTGLLPNLLAPLAAEAEEEAGKPKPFMVYPEEEAGPRILLEEVDAFMGSDVDEGMMAVPSSATEKRVIITLRPDEAVQQAQTFEGQFMAIEAGQDEMLWDYADTEMWDVKKVHAFPVMIAT